MSSDDDITDDVDADVDWVVADDEDNVTVDVVDVGDDEEEVEEESAVGDGNGDADKDEAVEVESARGIVRLVGFLFLCRGVLVMELVLRISPTCN